MISKSTLLKLVACAVLAPIAMVLSFAVGALLDGLADDEGARTFYRVAAGLGVAWGVSLVAMVLSLSVNSITASEAWPIGEELEPPEDQSLEE